MARENEILPLLENCRHELQRLHQYAAELKNACATNERFLTGGTSGPLAAIAVANSDRLTLHCQSWRQKAERARDVTYRVTVAKAKPGLLEIADTYDRLQR